MRNNRIIATLLAASCAGALMLTACAGTPAAAPAAPAGESEEAAEAEAPSAEEEVPSIVEEIPHSEDYKKLAAAREVNPDVYAWLTIPGTDFDTPIVQYEGEDQTYYLTHNAEGAEDELGALYTEYYLGKSFEDNYDVIVFGRNVEGRFAELHRYTDQAFFDANRTIIVTDENDVQYEYTIFAAITTDDRHPHHDYDFSTEYYRIRYLNDEILSHSGMDEIVDADAPVYFDSRLLTLLTGSSNPDNRFMVIAYRNEVDPVEAELPVTEELDETGIPEVDPEAEQPAETAPEEAEQPADANAG